MAYGAMVSVAPKRNTSGRRQMSPKTEIRAPMIRAVKNAVAADFSASPPFLSPSEREM